MLKRGLDPAGSIKMRSVLHRVLKPYKDTPHGASGDIGFTRKASNTNGLQAVRQQYLLKNRIALLNFEGVPVMERLFSCP